MKSMVKGVKTAAIILILLCVPGARTVASGNVINTIDNGNTNIQRTAESTGSTDESAIGTTEQKQIQDDLISEFDFDEIDRSLKSLFPNTKLDFGGIVQNLISGNMDQITHTLVELVTEKFTYEFRYHKKTLIHILLIAIMAAVFTNFSNAFQNKQISETSFYVLYLLLITICLSSFRIAMSSVETDIGHVLEFMGVLCPAYFLSVAVAIGSTTSMIFYQIVLMVIYLVELIIVNILLPMINIYMMVQILNYLSDEEYLTQFGELLEKAVSWTLKTLMALVIGMNVIQGILSPAIDNLKRSVVGRTAEAIPVVGDAIGGVTEVVLGTAALIKNGIGIAGACICLFLCVTPLIKMAVMVLLYKLVSALVQPISDKRIVGCISSVSKGSELLVRVIYTVSLLFLVTIAIIAATVS